MIEVKNMLVEDFLAIMAQNAEVYPEFDKLQGEQKRYLANINIITGIAQSFFENGELVAVAGMRYVGLGEGWLLTPKNIREERSLSLLRETKKTFIRIRDDHNLWRCFATSKISENFLSHLGFKKQEDVLIWTRE